MVLDRLSAVLLGAVEWIRYNIPNEAHLLLEIKHSLLRCLLSSCAMGI